MVFNSCLKASLGGSCRRKATDEGEASRKRTVEDARPYKAPWSSRARIERSDLERLRELELNKRSYCMFALSRANFFERARGGGKENGESKRGGKPAQLVVHPSCVLSRAKRRKTKSKNQL